MLDLRNLETFVWVARLGSFRASAEKLNTTQPAISARIAMLERDLGTRVFDRRSRRVLLTVKGAELLGYAERMLTLRSEMLRAVGDPASLRGGLRLGVPETIVHTWLAELVDRISVIYPSISLDVDVDSTPNLRRGLLAGKLDLAFLGEHLHDAALKTTPLCRYPLGWFIGDKLELPKGRIGVAAVTRWPIITFRRESAPHLAVRKFLAAAGFADARVFGSSSIAGTVRMTLDGIGTCVLPGSVVARELASGQLRSLPLPHELPSIEFFVSYPTKPDSFLAAAVAELAIGTAIAHLARSTKSSSFSIGRIQRKN